MQRTKIDGMDDAPLVERIAEGLRQRGALGGLDAPLVTKLLRLGDVIDLKAGEALVREGDPAAPEIYLLFEGSLVVQSKGAFIARLDKPGDVVGEVAVVLASVRTADVIAESAVRAVAIPSDVIVQEEFADVAAGVRGAMLRDDWVKY